MQGDMKGMFLKELPVFVIVYGLLITNHYYCKLLSPESSIIYFKLVSIYNLFTDFVHSTVVDSCIIIK